MILFKSILLFCILTISTPSFAGVMGLLGAGFDAPTISGKDNVSSPRQGEMIFDTTVDTFYGYSGTSWMPLSSGAASLPTQVITSNTTLATGTRYIVNKSSTPAELTLPASCTVGDEIGVVGVGSGGWVLNSNDAATAQTVFRGSVSTPTSSNSEIELVSSSSNHDCMTLICVTGDSVWNIISYVGTTMGSYMTATGGTITTDGDYKVHTFTSSGTFEITSGSGVVDSLVVAGGGAGGATYGGGGGGGGVVATSPGASYGIDTYTVTIGAGGTGGSGAGGNGGNSTFDLITATGGGGGGDNGVNGSNGGSGGGGGAAASGGTGTTLQGNNGGGGTATGNLRASGGGGAGAAGESVAGLSRGGNGGVGISNSITGSPVYYGGGGGGMDQTGASPGTGGNGGGGAGGSNTAQGTAGTPNTGGGSGGGRDGVDAANGGSGVVIVRYKFQ